MADDPKPGDAPEADELETEDVDDAEPEPDGLEAEPDDADDDGGDEPEPEPEGGDEPQPAARPAARGGRAAQTIRQLRERAQRAERELAARGQSQQPNAADQQARYEADEAKKLQAATEAEQLGAAGAVAKYWHDRTLRETQGVTQFSANQSFEREDAREFRLLQREIPAYGKVADFVEDTIAKARQRGDFSLTREAVAKYRIGELAIKRAQNGGGQRTHAALSRQRNTVRPPAGGSDQPAPRRGARKAESEWTTEDYERNLADRPILPR